jgi:hypothetical protein
MLVSETQLIAVLAQLFSPKIHHLRRHQQLLLLLLLYLPLPKLLTIRLVKTHVYLLPLQHPRINTIGQQM